MIEIVATSTKRLAVTKSTFICTLKKRTLLLMHFLENKRLQKGLQKNTDLSYPACCRENDSSVIPCKAVRLSELLTSFD